MSSEQLTHITSVINQYLQLESEIKELRKAIKERQYKSGLLEQSILTFMEEDAQVESIKLSNNDQEIVPIKRNQVKEVSKKNLMTIIEDNLKNNPELLKKIKDDMEAKKTTTQVEKIKVKKLSSCKLTKESAVSDALLSS